jgi:hypothetical protein
VTADRVSEFMQVVVVCAVVLLLRKRENYKRRKEDIIFQKEMLTKYWKWGISVTASSW